MSNECFLFADTQLILTLKKGECGIKSLLFFSECCADKNMVNLPIPVITSHRKQRLQKQTTPPPPVSCSQLHLFSTKRGAAACNS